jgi:hypothetical protein
MEGLRGLAEDDMDFLDQETVFENEIEWKGIRALSA